MTYQSEILKALATETGGGSFTQSVSQADGEPLVHRFSWATGMASSHWEWKYRNAFAAAPPKWVAFEHPYVRSRLYQIAMNSRKHLPKKKPLLSINAI